MKLQLALDDLSLEEGLELTEEVNEFIDIIEIGTPMIIEYGVKPIEIMKKQFPQLEILADLKIMDAGYYEAEEALKVGADYITVLGVTDNLTIQGCVDAAKDYHGKVVVDMICVDNLKERIKKVEELGVDIVSVHTGVDQQAMGRTPLDDLKIMKEAVRKAKISVAGGISTDTIEKYKALSPEIIIVGSGITHAKNAKEAAKKIKQVIRG